jgi:glyoxylase-like metal-dependent hydrolase (beta-lactamase superfamily II)
MKLYQHYSIYGCANSYLLGDDETKQAILVDPSEFNAGVLNHIERNGYYVRAVLLTHNHVHHVRGLRTLLKIYEAEVFAGTSQVLGLSCRVVKDEERLAIAGFSVDAFSVPGHSSDSMIYKIDKLLFTGDTLHAGVPGRTLSPFNTRLLIERLQTKILPLEDDLVVLPGHGPPSTLGVERRYNLAFKEGFAAKLTAPYDFFV